ncbi:AraC family transcriptional regulator [Paenibacillus sp. LHD-117]|uniref:helix-turn-helix transcriptional regulator n=1 Tax=Paenibacillus sp. LHD-117 TaxID=3071412 RepID=UPI0027E1E021|nr:AraC family transcriptional regulator [Paenibacillus sp. LHD-117]MDQ6421442.1 AraC family transcriptional regulator [Paenibacillus sp. LHD-117]
MRGADSTPPEVFRQYQVILHNRREGLHMHLPMEKEVQMLAYIKNGEPEKFKKLFNDLAKEGDPIEIYQQLQFTRYLFCASIALFCRFAVDGGCTHDEAYSLSDAYIMHMHTLNTVQQVFSLIAVVGADYAERVQSVKKNHLPIVRQCISYISENLFHKLTIKSIARACGTSESYLSALFHKKMGINLKRYITEAKLEASTELLIHSEFTISEIAVKLSFPSHSAFTSKFKNKFGITPIEYRNQYFGTWGLSKYK